MKKILFSLIIILNFGVLKSASTSSDDFKRSQDFYDNKFETIINSFVLISKIEGTEPEIKNLKKIINNVSQSAKDKALNFASRRAENIEVINLLLKHGANVNAIDQDGNTPLLNAMQYEKLRIGERFLRDLCVKDIFKTAQKIELLLIAGAATNIKNKYGRSFLSLIEHLDEESKKQIVDIAKKAKEEIQKKEFDKISHKIHESTDEILPINLTNIVTSYLRDVNLQEKKKEEEDNE